ncbi:MAG: hypothetical protein HYZ49_13620 [Chloroflexi bacterium]|nr:hypothetical protein [Chloroflexota bacterium]
MAVGTHQNTLIKLKHDFSESCVLEVRNSHILSVRVNVMEFQRADVMVVTTSHTLATFILDSFLFKFALSLKGLQVSTLLAV